MICVRPKLLDHDIMSGWHMLRTMLLVMEKLLEDEETQVGVVCGHVFVGMTIHWCMVVLFVGVACNYRYTE